LSVTSDTGPFAIIPEWVIDAATPSALKLYAILARYADLEGHAYPSRRTLAERLAVSAKHITALIGELRGIGALDVVERFDGRGQISNEYHVIRRRPDAPIGTTGAGGIHLQVQPPLHLQVQGKKEREPPQREKDQPLRAGSPRTSGSPPEGGGGLGEGAGEPENLPAGADGLESGRDHPPAPSPSPPCSTGEQVSAIIGKRTQKTPAQRLVARYVDLGAAAGVRPTKTTVGRLAREVDGILRDGSYPEPVLAAAIDRMYERGKIDPSMLGSFAAGIALAEAKEISGEAEADRAFRKICAAGWPTGARLVRGSHGASVVYDPLGTDPPPRDVEWERPSRDQVMAAIKDGLKR
jgi:hypothetical protein